MRQMTRLSSDNPRATGEFHHSSRNFFSYYLRVVFGTSAPAYFCRAIAQFHSCVAHFLRNAVFSTRVQSCTDAAPLIGNTLAVKTNKAQTNTFAVAIGGAA